MKPMLVSILSILSALLVQGNAWAQFTSINEGPIVYGHHHVNATSIEAHKKFWADALGGTPMKAGNFEIVRVPNVLVFLNQRPPSGGTKGTTVNHIGFQVPSTRAMVDKLKAAGYPIVTRAELPPSYEVKDDLTFIADQNTFIAFVMGPDDVKVEIVENKTMKEPIALHHIHFAGPVEEMRDWYAKTFSAKPGMRGSFQHAALPGVSLTFSAAPAPVVGTQGRSLDHIGFEIKDLEKFCKQLEGQGVKFERPYTKSASLNIAIAFIRDPWGTYIELTEGLSTLK